MYNQRINSRRSDAYHIRKEAAQMARSRPHPDHLGNGEEESYRNPQGRLSYIGNFSKGLRHNYIGEVVPDAYRMMVRAMYSTNPILFERVGMMGTLNGLNLINPQAGLAFDLEGPDAQAVTMPPAPRIDGAEAAGEMGELYWMALIRDVNFANYAANPLVTAAVGSLNAEFTDFRGPRIGGLVTPQTLFRGFTPGDLNGPYISQFLLKPIPYGTLTIPQLNRIALPGVDYLTGFNAWLRIQNGRPDSDANSLNDLAENMIPPAALGSLFAPLPRNICTLRDLATYVHFDALYEAYLNACLILLGMPARVDPGNPYVDMPMQRTQRTQDGFGTFGPPHILTLVTEVATRALKAVWFQKWGVHRRLRPEEFGGRIHVHLHGVPAGGLFQPAVPPGRYAGMIHPDIINSLNGGALGAFFGPGTYLLPQAFKEGAPTHPAYASGHATVAGACVTVLKAWFDESETFDPGVVPLAIPGIPGPVLNQMRLNRRPIMTNAGCNIVNYVGPPLTVGGELNKLAGNISQARNAAGVHWRSDYTEGLILGEEIAIRLLQEQKLTYNEDHHLSLTKFDGTSISI
jgi:hypothetical protein